MGSEGREGGRERGREGAKEGWRKETRRYIYLTVDLREPSRLQNEGGREGDKV